MDRAAADYLEATVSNLLNDQLPQPGDSLLVGRLGVIPKLTQLIPPLGVRDVLVVPPEAIEPAIELGDEVVVVVSTAGCFAEVGVFVFGGEGHGNLRDEGKVIAPSWRVMCRLRATHANLKHQLATAARRPRLRLGSGQG